MGYDEPLQRFGKLGDIRDGYKLFHWRFNYYMGGIEYMDNVALINMHYNLGNSKTNFVIFNSTYLYSILCSWWL